MKQFLKNAITFVISHVLDFLISYVLSLVLAGALVVFGDDIGVVYIVILAVVFFLACLFAILYITGPKMPDFKWNEKVTRDLYELKIVNKSNFVFHRKSEFKPIHPHSVITKYGQYDWNDCSINSVNFTENTIHSLSELEFKGVDSSNTVCANKILSKDDSNLNDINNCKYKTMEYICRYHPNNDPHILEYYLDMKPQNGFKKQLFAIIKRPVDELTLKLVINNSVLVENVSFEAETALGEKYSIKPKRIIYADSVSDDGSSQIYKIVIKNPKMFCRYSIYWS